MSSYIDEKNIDEKIKLTEEKLNRLKEEKKKTIRKLKRGKKEKRFRLTYNLKVDLLESQIWPDKDGPLNPTKDDVLEAIWNYEPLDENSFTRNHPALIILDEWRLIDCDEDILKITEIKSKK